MSIYLLKFVYCEFDYLMYVCIQFFDVCMYECFEIEYYVCGLEDD